MKMQVIQVVYHCYRENNFYFLKNLTEELPQIKGLYNAIFYEKTFLEKWVRCDVLYHLLKGFFSICSKTGNFSHSR